MTRAGLRWQLPETFWPKPALSLPRSAKPQVSRPPECRGNDRLPGQRLAVQQSRDDRQIALNRKALRTIPVDAQRGAYASFGAAHSG
jgi:hypothetical protein